MRSFIRQNRDNFTDGQKLAIWERCGHRCQGCGRKLRPFEPKQFDHIEADALGGEAMVENGQVLGECCYKPKNAEDQAIVSRCDAQAKKHVLGRKRKMGWGWRG